RRIGIVSSAQAAALRDILNILRRRHRTASILIYPAQVQGENAPIEVSAGIRYFNKARNVDVIIVARGGGSAEDLAAFNHEGLARTVASSAIPIISAVGHETDFTIIDFVTDLRAPTPSAAAELVIRSRQEVEEQAEGLHRRLVLGIRYRVAVQRRGRLEQLSGRLDALSPMAILERGYALVFDASGKLVKDAAQVQVGEEISARLARGEIGAVVKKRS